MRQEGEGMLYVKEFNHYKLQISWKLGALIVRPDWVSYWCGWEG